LASTPWNSGFRVSNSAKMQPTAHISRNNLTKQLN
jgi:hypothetical protein